MAALPTEPTVQSKSVSPQATGLREDPRIRLAQLQRLHAEAAETATLANLLGRAPQVAAVLVVSALVVAGLAFGTMPLAEVVVWLALVAAGVATLWRSCARTMAAPFELFPLRGFAQDLCAILFYAGFAWGAGAFLALGAQQSIAAAVLFAGLPCVLVALTARVRTAVWCFVAPVCMLTVLAVAARPLGGVAAAGLVALLGVAVAGLSVWLERVSGYSAAAEPAILALR